MRDADTDDGERGTRDAGYERPRPRIAMSKTLNAIACVEPQYSNGDVGL